MTDTRRQLEERVRDVNAVLRLLGDLQLPEARIAHRSASGPRVARISFESVSVLKATVFIVLYNMVESTVRSSFAVLYDQIVAENLQISRMSLELRKQWIAQNFLFGGMNHYSASPKNYHEVAERLVDNSISNVIAELNGQRLPISGNLDADEIRSVCQRHGVSVKTPARAQGGTELLPVRQNRNALAHGELTFSECGRQYTVDDLRRIAKQTELYLRFILRNIRRFGQKRRYLAS